MSSEVETGGVDIDISEPRVSGASEPEVSASWPNYMRSARRSWWIIAITVIAGGLAAFMVGATGATVYESSATVALVPQRDVVSAEKMFEVTNALGIEEVMTTGELLETDATLRAAAKTLGLDPDEVATSYEVVAAGSLQGFTVGLVVTGPDADITSDLAVGAATVVSEQFVSMYPGMALDIIDAPDGAPGASSESGGLAVVIGILIGLGVGFLIAVARGPGRARSSISSGE